MTTILRLYTLNILCLSLVACQGFNTSATFGYKDFNATVKINPVKNSK